MFIIPFVIAVIVSFAFEYFKGTNFWRGTIVSAMVLVFTFSVVVIDYLVQTYDTEVWSGTVINWYHKDAYDEWHPESCTTTTDRHGNSTTSCTPGYWEHHNAVNKIKTTDNGWMKVTYSPDGYLFNDDWPASASELKQMWPPGTPSASVHRYENKVQASYSLYKIDGIDEKDFPDLPKYPNAVTSFITINRIVGDVPNKEKANQVLNQKNSELNKFIPDPERPGKKRSWKQVNIIFVNVGENKDENYGYALQNAWKNGNKNDFIVSFSMNRNGKLNWVHVFSWSEVEILKMEVRDYLMNKGKVTDFVPVVKKVSKMVAEKFERKQFADFSYLKVEVSEIAQIIIWILAGVTLEGQYIHYYKNERRERRLQKFLESLNQRTIQVGDKSVKIRVLK